MGIMQKETISHRRSNAIIASVIFGSAMIFLGRAIGNIRLYNTKIEVVTDPLLIFMTLAIFAILFRKCRVSYKYSVIADQLIIHKVISEKQKVLEDIKVEDIVYLGEDKDRIKEFSTKGCRSYTCRNFEAKKCCIYKKNNKTYKFYFQASDRFVNKVNNLKINIDKQVNKQVI